MTDESVGCRISTGKGVTLLEGTYYQTLWRNEFTGETVFLFSPTEYHPQTRDGLIRCRGKVGVYYYRLPLRLSGEFKDGEYSVTSAEVSSEGQTGKMLDYFFEGTGETLTIGQKNKIAELAGGDILVFAKTEKAKEKLAVVLKDENKASAILGGCRKLNEQAEVTKLCLAHGLSLGEIDSLLRQGTTLGDLRHNAYLAFLSAEIHIYKADAVMKALRPDFAVYAPERIYGYVMDAMRISEKCGNTCVTAESLCALMGRRMKHSGMAGTVSPAMLAPLFLHQKGLSHVRLNGRVYLYRTSVLEEEDRAIRALGRLKHAAGKILPTVSPEEAENLSGIPLNEGQQNALHLLETGGVKLLIGPPGSGKTSLIKALIRLYKEKTGGLPVRLAATTGRAAQVMASACGEKAETLHKLLDVRPFGESITSKDENRPIESGFIIVDEASMMGLKLFSLLIRAVKSGSILLLVGDKDQLQSVEYGNVLVDLQESGLVETYELTEVMRQSGLICSNARKINRGDPMLGISEVFQEFRCAREEDALAKLLSRVFPGQDMVLSTVKKGLLGTCHINSILQAERSGGDQFLEYGDTRFYVGDPVIMTETSYKRGYYNGDIGVVLAIEVGGLAVNFSGRKIILGKEDLPRTSPAYCITVHKSQGSEFGNVHILLPATPGIMLTRRILYTAVTRAKRKVFLYSVDHAAETAVSNISERQRVSLLRERLRSTEIP